MARRRTRPRSIAEAKERKLTSTVRSGPRGRQTLRVKQIGQRGPGKVSGISTPSIRQRQKRKQELLKAAGGVKRFTTTRASGVGRKVTTVRRTRTGRGALGGGRVRKIQAKRFPLPKPVRKEVRVKTPKSAVFPAFVAQVVQPIRKVVDTEIEDFNIRTGRKDTEIEFPKTQQFKNVFGDFFG